MKVLISSGGSGGHIFPAIALARTLKMKSDDIEIRFVGSDKALDRRIFEREAFRFWLLSVNRLPYGISIKLVGFFLRLLPDLVKALFIIASYRPAVVIGFGGYVSFPVILTACFFRIPRIVHEQNVMPGRANSLLFKLADDIAVSFEETKKRIGDSSKKAVFTGNPIRREIFSEFNRTGAKAEDLKKIGFSAGKFTILVIGGSQGARFLNETFIKAVSALGADKKASLQIIHITGVKDYEWVLGAYRDAGDVGHRVYSFIDRIEEAYSASDLVITRSGSSAIFELAFFARPMLLVPYPFAMSHQVENARAFGEKGAAIVMDEKSLSVDMLKDAIAGLLNDEGRLKSLGEAAKRLSVPEASDNLAMLVLDRAKRG